MKREKLTLSKSVLALSRGGQDYQVGNTLTEDSSLFVTVGDRWS